MRKFTLVCLSLAVILSLGLLVSAPVALANDCDFNYYGKTTLGVQFSQSNVDWTVAGNAQSNGEKVKGQIQAQSNGEFGKFHGNVTCYCQCGNVSWFSGPAKYTNESNISLVGFLFIVEDNGEPGDGVDRIRWRGLLDEPDGNYCCAIPAPPFYSDFIIYAGNAQVHE